MKKFIPTGTICLFLCLLTLNSSFAQRRETIVLVHGAWGGGWTFKEVGEKLIDSGHVVYRPTMSGLGERQHLRSPEIDINTHIIDIVNTILFEDLHDIVLLGHSYGGAVITGVADSIPERIKKMIFLDAIVLNDGESLATSRPGVKPAQEKLQQEGFVIPVWVKDSQPLPHDVPQSAKTFVTPVSWRNQKAKAIPVTYIFTMDDLEHPQKDDFYHYAKRAELRGWRIVEMHADHNPQRSIPEELTKILLNEF